MADETKRKPDGALENPPSGVARPLQNVVTYQTSGLRGGRYNGLQQDRVLSGELHLRNAEGARAALASAFEKADAATRTFVDAGATATVAIATPDDRLSVGQVGDSTAFLYVFNEKTGTVRVLNFTENQKPDAPSERRRIEQAGGVVRNGRMYNAQGASLSVGRALGDHDFPSISAEPTITSVDISRYLRDPRMRTFVVVASDGLTEHSDPKSFATFLRDDPSLSSIAEHMARHSIRAANRAGEKLGDNTSLSMAELKSNHVATFVGVSDGHFKRGEHCAAVVQETMTRGLQDYAARLADPGIFEGRQYWDNVGRAREAAGAESANVASQALHPPNQPRTPAFRLKGR